MQTFSKTYVKSYNDFLGTRFEEFKFHKSFERIHKLLGDKGLVTHHLANLDKAVGEHATKHGKEHDYHVCFAIYDTLRAAETTHGFDPHQVWYLGGLLSGEKFTEMLEKRCAFLDPKVSTRHGAESHRIQWWIIIHDMKENAGSYDKTDAGTLFAEAQGKDAKSKEKNKKNDDMWYHTFDANQGLCDDARNPESLKDFFMPTFEWIAKGEEASMSWNTTAKLSWADYPKFGSEPKHWAVKKFGG